MAPPYNPLINANLTGHPRTERHLRGYGFLANSFLGIMAGCKTGPH